MTSLSDPPLTRVRPRDADPVQDLATRRPLVLVALLGGVLAAAGPLVVCLALGVVGWFLTDAGAHGSPSDALRVGAFGWLLGHGSGVSIDGVRVTAAPLGLTAAAAWVCWRLGRRVGESISGHGPDADRIGDGERDWVVPTASGLFVAGYLLTAVTVLVAVSTRESAPDSARVVLWSVLLATAAGGTGIAVGSGRAATWASLLPVPAVAAARTCRAVLVTWLAVATAWVLGAFVLDVRTAANVVSQLHTDAGDVVLLVVLSIAVLPNAVLFSGSYLLGPGFAVGAGTLVSPTTVAIGPLPMFPALAALPDVGPTPGWTPWVMAMPLVVAVVAAALVTRRVGVLRWDEAALSGAAGGIAAGLVFGVLAGLSGGAVGPGRMREVGPFAVEVLLHALTTFGIGSLLGALAMTWWLRRSAQRAS